MAMLMALVVAGKLTCDPEIKETGKGIKHYVLTMYLGIHSKDQRVNPHRVKFKFRSSIENTWLGNAKKGDPVTISLNRATQWWGGDGVIVISGWTNQIRLHTEKQSKIPEVNDSNLLGEIEDGEPELEF